MISHKYRCIFVHIQRTAGSSLENWICGSDWWHVDKKTKHLVASQAKELYKEYWDDYFKFSFVRNPWDRVVSSLKFPRDLAILYKRPRLMPFLKRWNFEGYRNKFGTEIVLEHDHRFYERKDLISDQHLPGQVYGNILDEELDFIGRFETLAADCREIRGILGIEKEMDIHTQKSAREGAYHTYYNRYAKQVVGKLYAKDIERFNYHY